MTEKEKERERGRKAVGLCHVDKQTMCNLLLFIARKVYIYKDEEKHLMRLKIDALLTRRSTLSKSCLKHLS